MDDSTPVMAVVILMFVLPSRLDFWCFRSRSGGPNFQPKPSSFFCFLVSFDFAARNGSRGTGRGSAQLVVRAASNGLGHRHSFRCQPRSYFQPPTDGDSFYFFKKKGGGFALSDASLQSGLSDWLGQQLSVLRVLPPFVIMLVRALVDKKWPFFLFKK